MNTSAQKLKLNIHGGNILMILLFEFFDDSTMQFVTEVFHGAVIRLEDNRRIVVR